MRLLSLSALVGSLAQWALLGLVGGGRLYAQAPSWIWAKSAGNANDPRIAVDASGNVYVTGSFSDDSLTFGSITLIRNKESTEVISRADMFVVKYDPNGQVLWAKSAGGSEDEYARDIAVDARGNVYVIGEFKSDRLTLGSTTLKRKGEGDFFRRSDIFIVKYDSNGQVLWAKSVGGNDDEYARSIAVDAGGNVYVTGYFVSDTLTFGPITLRKVGRVNIFLVKYDPNGQVLWAKSAGGSEEDKKQDFVIILGRNDQSITVDASGNVYLAGSFSSSTLTFGSTTLRNAGQSDIFLVKYDPNGQLLWAKSVGGEGNEALRGIAVDAQGNIYVTGYFGSYNLTLGSTTLRNATGIGGHSFDIFVMKYGPNGQVVWAKSIGGWGNEGGEDITVDASGNIYVTGTFWSDSLIFGSTIMKGGPRYNFFDFVGAIFVVKYNPNGEVVWAKGISGGESRGIAVDARGNVYVIGWCRKESLTLDAIELKNTNKSIGLFVGKLKP